jgi:hypothetical protein
MVSAVKNQGLNTAFGCGNNNFGLMPKKEAVMLYKESVKEKVLRVMGNVLLRQQ